MRFLPSAGICAGGELVSGGAHRGYLGFSGTTQSPPKLWGHGLIGARRCTGRYRRGDKTRNQLAIIGGSFVLEAVGDCSGRLFLPTGSGFLRWHHCIIISTARLVELAFDPLLDHPWCWR